MVHFGFVSLPLGTCCIPRTAGVGWGYKEKKGKREKQGDVRLEWKPWNCLSFRRGDREIQDYKKGSGCFCVKLFKTPQGSLT